MTEIIAWAGLTVTVLLAYATIHRQQKATLQLQREHLRDQIKVDLYRALLPQLQGTERALGNAATILRTSVGFLRMNLDGFPTKPPASHELTEAVFKACRELSAILIALEGHEIIFSRFASIHRAIGQAHAAILEAHRAFSKPALLYFPVADASAVPSSFHPRRPNDQELDELDRLTTELVDDLGRASAYVVDVRVEAQNELLGGLFDRNVPPRRPGDATEPVLRRDGEAQAERPEGGRWT